MKTESAGRADAAAARDVLEFYYPLALTAVMMAVSNPLINAGIARLPEATTGLAAYALAFNLSVLLHSPIFMAQQTAVALVKGGGSYRSVRRFTYALGIALALFEGAIAWSPLGRLAYLHLYGAEPAVADAAVTALRLMFPFPLFIAQRAFYQAMLMLGRDTRKITVATFARLAFLASGLWVGCVVMGLPGATVGAAALTLSVGLEAAMAWWGGRTTAREMRRRADVEPVPDLLRVVRFFLPLGATTWLWSVTTAVVSAIVIRGRDAEVSLAVYAVVANAAWLIGSPSLMLQQTALAMARDEPRRRTVRDFATAVSLGVTALFALAAIPGPRELLLRDLAGLDAALLERAQPVMALMIAYPLLLGCRSYFQGLLIRDGRTTAVSAAAVTRIVLIVLAGFPLAPHVPVSGAVFGAILIQGGFAFEVLWLAMALRRPSRAA